MEALLRVHVRFQTLSNQFANYVYDKGCIQGNRLQDFIHNSSPNVRYFLQLLARLPLLLAMHFWFLLGPYSENNMFGILCFLVRMIVIHTIARAWIFNTKTLFLYYIIIYLELFIATMEESFYWTIQNETNEVCHITGVITLGNGEENWRIPAICFLLIETIYFWLHVYYTRTLQNLSQFKLYCLVFTVFLVPIVLPIFGILPHLLSTVGYLLNKICLAVLLITKTFEIEKSDERFDLMSLNEEVNKCTNLEGDAKSKSKQRIVFLQNRLKMNRDEAHVFNYFANDNGVRDIFFIFGLLYFGIALILEVFHYDNNNISDPESLNSVCKFLLRWSTTLVPVISISFCLSFIDRIMIGLSVWIVSWEITLIDAMNIRTDSRFVHFSLFTLLVESGIPSSSTDLDIEAVVTIALMLYCFVIQKAVDIGGRNIIEICNRSPDLKIWFYSRACFAFLILLIIHLAVFGIVISKEVWLVFVASGSILIISSVIFIVIEWGLVSLPWYVDQHISTLEHGVQYIPVARECSCIVLLPIQFYARYMLSMFRAWWILRAGNLILNYIVLVYILTSNRKKVNDHNKRMLLLLNNFSDVSYAPLNDIDREDYTCSICFSSLRDGKELPCKHVFHKECLRRWFKIRTVCPTCNLALI